MISTIISLIIIYLLNLIDYFQTRYVISIFGLGVEANPIGRFLFEHNLAWPVKILVVPILLLIAGYVVKVNRKLVWMVYLLLVLYLFVVTSNFIMLIYAGIL